jgi:hypothetical protein
MLVQEELQRKSEQLKEQKNKQIKEIKHEVKHCLVIYQIPEVIEQIILDYSFKESTIETNNSLKEKVKKYSNTENEHLIPELDVSCVTSMYQLFYIYGRQFNLCLNNWDTSNVIDMSYMFSYCVNFNQPVNFDTKNVINMRGMFAFSFRFNQPVNFDTKNVVDMSGMFVGCNNFNRLVNLDTKNVVDMHCMFERCHKFNQPVNFDTKNVTNMMAMFDFCFNF